LLPEIACGVDQVLPALSEQDSMTGESRNAPLLMAIRS
jgi:hypothetical protein